MEDVQAELQAGIAAVQHGDRQTARVHLLRVLQRDPKNESAWFWISRAMTTTEQALRCIDHLLSLNPHHAQAREEREILQIRLLLEEASLAQAPPSTPSTPQRRYLLGEALLEARVITEAQLAMALQEQQRLARHGQRLRLGEVLLRLKYITPQQLAGAIMAQSETLDHNPERGMGPLGAFLVRRNFVTRAQLCQALSHQQALQHSGQHLRLGDALVSLGYLTPARLQQALREWEIEFNANFY
ncbi:tetratricopeptide repeat protein [Kallotenue papyrolyticum]|uniref:tetratricopeptide repeat protein n=1 Tax=Kallotenue papyrolyticum TaxID=1325125 RepID=UPI00047861D0|nr:hypothetical protein [Kallotenue papyrolyticum]